MKRFRRGAEFVPDSLCFRPIDRNQRTRIIVAAEALERKTKPKGAKSGALGASGLRVLRCLLYDFAHIGSGRCCPSYRKLQERTRYCFQTISRALQRLEASGLVQITRRLLQLPQGAIMDTNAYAFSEHPGAVPSLGEISRETTNLKKKEGNQLPIPGLIPPPLSSELRFALRRLGESMGLDPDKIPSLRPSE